MHTLEELLEIKEYSVSEITEACTILADLGTENKRYNLYGNGLTLGQYKELGNFFMLSCPIAITKDSVHLVFGDCEGYYMAQRTEILDEQKLIATMSLKYGESRKARKLFTLEQSTEKRIEFMRKALRAKYLANPTLQEVLISTRGRTIIELTFWGDMFFGIDQDNRRGANILGKLLKEEYDFFSKT